MNLLEIFKNSLSSDDITVAVARLTQEHPPTSIDEKRGQDRTHLDCPAMLKTDTDFAWMPIYIRDISPTGIGFAHAMQLDEGPVVVAFQPPGGDQVALKAQIIWCRQVEPNWYLSGGNFLAVLNERFAL